MQKNLSTPRRIALLIAVIAAGKSVAQERNGGGSPFGTTLIDKIENTTLPFIGDNSEFRIELNPKVGDLFDEKYFRFPMRAEYNFTSKFQAYVGYTPFLENPFRSEPENSLGYFRYGLKKRIDALENDRLAIAVGLDTRLPLESIPTDWIRDNYDTYSPFLVAAYEVDRNGEWTAFTDLRYDSLDKSNPEIEYLPEHPRSLASVTIGGVHHPYGDFRYALRLLYLTDRFDGGDSDGIKLLPSITWYTKDDTPFFRNIVGNFEITFELEYAVQKLPEQWDESDLGVSLDLRWRLQRKVEKAKHDLMP